MEKICTHCHQSLSLELFYSGISYKTGFSSQCKACIKERVRERARTGLIKQYQHAYQKTYRETKGSDYYKQAKARHRAKTRAQKDAIKSTSPFRKADKFALFFDLLAEFECMDCGYNNPIALEFDHRDPETKIFSISFGLSQNLPWEAILEEIAKCDVVCANCHKIRTAAQRNWKRFIRFSR